MQRPISNRTMLSTNNEIYNSTRDYTKVEKKEMFCPINRQENDDFGQSSQSSQSAHTSDYIQQLIREYKELKGKLFYLEKELSRKGVDVKIL